METRIQGKLRAMKDFPGCEDSQAQFAVEPTGSRVIVQALPELTEGCRMATSYQIYINTGGPATSLIVNSTTSTWGIYNREPHNGKSYIVTDIGMWRADSAGAAEQLTIWGYLGQGLLDSSSINNNGNTWNIKSQCGAIQWGPSCVQGITLSSPNNFLGGYYSNWIPFADSIVCANTASIMQTVTAKVKGRIIINPRNFFFVYSSGQSGNSCNWWIRWMEAKLDLDR